MSDVQTKAPDEVFCSSCGVIIKKEAEICPKCGVRQNPKKTSDVSQDWLVCLLLCIFVGAFGGHRFYTKKFGTAILMILTAGGCGVWTIIDLIMIISGKFQDANGNFITKDA